ncbi:MAG TPA: hypothetical protein VFA52_02480 [Candidatus Paceibacterota bacterium]|nr:hypothetical protein [Candidatus Paceibacterota bacterium]
MKNSQKGFIIPLLIIIVAALAIGGGFYLHSHRADVASNINTSLTATSSTDQSQSANQTSGQTSGTVNIHTVIRGSTGPDYTPNLQNSSTFKCDAGKTFTAYFNQPNVRIVFSDKSEMTLNQSTSSPHLFESAKNSFYVEGDEASLNVGGNLYQNCIVVH